MNVRSAYITVKERKKKLKEKNNGKKIEGKKD
jgi:hypothetical protein